MRRMLTDNVKGWGTPRPDLVRWPSRVPVDHLGEITVPTLVLRGGQENPNIVAAADLLAARIPRATLQSHLRRGSPPEHGGSGAVRRRGPCHFSARRASTRKTPRPGQGACA